MICRHCGTPVVPNDYIPGCVDAWVHTSEAPKGSDCYYGNIACAPEPPEPFDASAYGTPDPELERLLALAEEEEIERQATKERVEAIIQKFTAAHTKKRALEKKQ